MFHFGGCGFTTALLSVIPLANCIEVSNFTWFISITSQVPLMQFSGSVVQNVNFLLQSNYLHILILISGIGVAKPCSEFYLKFSHVNVTIIWAKFGAWVRSLVVDKEVQFLTIFFGCPWVAVILKDFPWLI